MTRIRLRFLLIIVLLTVLPAFSQTRRGADPIDKTGLLETLKDKVVRSKTLVAQIQRRGVSFKMTPEVEQEIRYAGKYLGNARLDDLITAIRTCYRESKKAEPSRVVNQEMKDSPGGIQAGGNVTINQGVQPRRLTAEQEAQFVKILKDNPKGSIDISCIESGGPEPCDFARQLVRLLESKEAEWTVSFSPLIFGAGDPTKTIPEMYILVQNAKNPPPRAVILQHALKAVGYNATGLERSNVVPDFVQLTIWFKNPSTGANAKQPDSTSQTMIGSPGGVQAGRDVIIQSDRRLIQSLELRISIDAETPEQVPVEESMDIGLGSVVALFTHDKTRIRFASDYRVMDQQINPRLRRLKFVYTPESPDQILGKEVEFLESIALLVFNYAEICKLEKFAINNERASLHMSIVLNGLDVGTVNIDAPAGRIASGQGSADISALFRGIPERYIKAVSR